MSNIFSNLTDEQLSIQRNCATFSTLPSMRMRIIARAGTGKTTSLEAIVMKIKIDACSDPSICYAAFNKTTETEFGERIHKKLMKHNLPRNDLESRTLHSLCYQWFISTRNNEYMAIKENIETDAVMKYFDVERYVSQRFGSGDIAVAVTDIRSKSKQQRIKFEATWIAELILKTLDNFLNSASNEVTDKHLPYHVTHRFPEWTSKFDEYLERHRILRITAGNHYAQYDFKNRAMALYQQALASNDAAGLTMTHSIYQKYAQLSNAILTSKKGKAFDMYLVDEAQDLNECQCALITRQWQNGATIALVGDPAQSIYQFRGACRQFERWEVDNEETLTQSFRFGKQVARLCNLFLGLEKLWLLSLKSTIEAKGLPVKKELGRPESAVKEEKLFTPGCQDPSPGNQPASTQPGLPGAPAGTSSVIKALVRGLPDVADKWVEPSAVMSYPHTVICRTNNSTYYALLAGIQAALREGNGECNEMENPLFTGTSNGLNNVNDKTILGTKETVKRKNKSLKRSFDQVASNSSGRSESSDCDSNSDDEDALPTTAVSAQDPASKKAPVSLRKFYINGVRSFEQLERGLVRRIEQLAGISVEKPYMYKGELYTNLDAVKGASIEMEDYALLELVEITEQWGADIEHIKNLIRNHYAPTAADADVLVTTVHKSKGLEWDSVALGDDIGSPLGAQPLYTIQCNADPALIPAGQEPPPPRFIVGQEANAKVSFARINHLLCVGEKEKEKDKMTATAVAGGAGVVVKPEPGPYYPLPPPLHNTLRSNGGVMANKLDGRFRESLDDDLVLDGDNMPTSAADYPQLPSQPVNGQFGPSVHNTLVPLLPSTVALGYQLQQGNVVTTPGGVTTPAGAVAGAASAVARGSKCPLVCCIPRHHHCVERVRAMYLHEIAERRRMFGQAAVCGLESNGDGVGNFRLIFSDQQTALPPGTLPKTSTVTPKTERQISATQSGSVAAAAQAHRLDPFLVKFTNRQNANEWYVAVSRAKRTLRVNADLLKILEWVDRDIGGLRTQLERVIGAEAHPIPPLHAL